MTDLGSPVRPHNDGRTLLRYAVIVGLAVRLVILWHTSALGPKIIDEGQYTRLAKNMLAGNGFAWSAGAPTSVRPPLYPALLAALWTVTGAPSFQAVRVVQIALALLTTVLVYQLGARAFSPRVGRYAAAAVWLYPSLLFFNFLILTETLFVFLLVAHLLCAIVLLQQPRAWVAVLCGLSLGLAALTRSAVFTIPLLLCPMLVFALQDRLARRVGFALLVLAGYLIPVAPWAVRNTRLQGVVTIVDTMGGMNLRMGNYEYTPDDRMWDAVSLTGTRSWSAELRTELNGRSITEGQRDKWAQRKAIEFMLAHPGITVRRSLIKFADFWGLEREFMAGVENGLYDPPRWFAVLGAFLIAIAYAGVAICGATGIWLAPPAERRYHAVLLLPVVVVLGIHVIVFGHSRYHLPLIPILALYGAAWAAAPKRISWPSKRFEPLAAAAVSVTVLIGIWIQQIVVADLGRIRAWLDHVR